MTVNKNTTCSLTAAQSRGHHPLTTRRFWSGTHPPVRAFSVGSSPVTTWVPSRCSDIPKCTCGHELLFVAPTRGCEELSRASPTARPVSPLAYVNLLPRINTDSIHILHISVKKGPSGDITRGFSCTSIIQASPKSEGGVEVWKSI